MRCTFVELSGIAGAKRTSRALAHWAARVPRPDCGASDPQTRPAWVL